MVYRSIDYKIQFLRNYNFDKYAGPDISNGENLL